jgi:hypothetical protein
VLTILSLTLLQKIKQALHVEIEKANRRITELSKEAELSRQREDQYR